MDWRYGAGKAPGAGLGRCPPQERFEVVEAVARGIPCARLVREFEEGRGIPPVPKIFRNGQRFDKGSECSVFRRFRRRS